MTEEEMIIETVRSMQEHGHDSPRRTDMVWKIGLLLRLLGAGGKSPKDLIRALDVVGLKVMHAAVGQVEEANRTVGKT